MKSLWPAILPALILMLFSPCSAAEPLIRVVVWDEQQPAQKQAYENFLGNAIAAHLAKQPGLRVISANINQPDKGLPVSLLENTDVLVWWGHVRHGEISTEMSQDIVARIKRGELALIAIALHSAHWSNPFVEAMYERTREDARKRYPDPQNGPPVKFEFIALNPSRSPRLRCMRTPSMCLTPMTPCLKRAGWPGSDFGAD